MLNIPLFYDISESERRMDIFNILKKLDSNCRKIIELAWLKELNNAQVAEKLNIHRNTVISRLKSCMEMAAKIGIDENGCQDRDTINLTIYPFPSQIELTQGMSGNLFVNLNDGLTEWFLDGINLNHNGTSFFYD